MCKPHKIKLNLAWTDAQLLEYLESHDEDEDAWDEWYLRRDCRNDSRVAQGLGCATGRDNEPS